MNAGTKDAPLLYESSVTYYTGRTTLSGVPALLRWQDGVITLTTAPKNSNAARRVIFGCTPKQISYVMMKGTALLFRIQGASYMLDTAPLKTRLAYGARYGLFAAMISIVGYWGGILFPRKRSLSDADEWWIGQLKAAGVPIRLSWLFALVLGILFVIVVILILTAPKSTP